MQAGHARSDRRWQRCAPKDRLPTCRCAAASGCRCTRSSGGSLGRARSCTLLLSPLRLPYFGCDSWGWAAAAAAVVSEGMVAAGATRTFQLLFAVRERLEPRLRG